MQRRYGILTLAIVLALALLTLGMADCWHTERLRAETAEELLRGAIATGAERSLMLQASESQVATLTAEVERLTSDNASLVVQVEELTPKPVAARTVSAPSSPAYQPGEIPDLIRSVAAGCGLGGSESELLVELARRESTWNPNATNGGCKGLFQLAGDYPDWADPTANTYNAIQYIEGRYGTVAAALAHHDQKGWY